MSTRPDAPDAVSRRAFVRLLGAGGAAAFAAACARPAEEAVPGADSAAAAPGSPAGAAAAAGGTALGIQLYTMRTVMGKDPEPVLAELGRIGYREVETAGLYDRTPADFRAMLDRAGLAATSGHVPIERMRADMAGALEEARVVGYRYVVAPWLGDKERTVDGYKRLAADLNRAAEQARGAGVRVAYHNHDFEFAPLAGGTPGQVGFDVLLAETDRALVDMELDLYWATKAGRSPRELFAAHPGRFPLVHVKDMTAAGAMADVGAGTIDFPAIFAAGPVRHFFVERDDATDPLATARASFAALRRMKA